MNHLKKEGYRDYQIVEFGFKPQGISPEYPASRKLVLPWVRQYVSLDSRSGGAKSGREEAQIPGRFGDVV
jgi:hypothetical protein